MYLNEQHTLYSLAHRFVEEYNFSVLYLNEKTSEVWLEKREQKKSQVVRLIHKGFDWKNHLKKDVAGVFQRVKSLKRILSSKHVEIFNIYVTTHQPIDSWEVLKKPMKLREKNPIWMFLYYLDEKEWEYEINRIETDIGMDETIDHPELSDESKTKRVANYKANLKNRMEEEKQKIESIFSYGKPFFTYILIAINLLLFIMLEMNGGSTNIQTLIDYGAKYNPAIILDNEWWRIISSMFLHIGFLHLLMNMLALYFLGTVVEKIFGTGRLLFIYMLSGIGGGLASFAVSDSVAAGASGAIFGLFGALLFFGLHYRRLFFQTMGQGLLLVLVINFVFGFTVAQIDMAAHLGGLITGFIAAGICHLPQIKEKKHRFLAGIIYIAVVAGLVGLGFYNSENSQLYQLTKAEYMVSEENFEQTISAVDQGLGLEGDLDVYLYFQRGYAYLQTGEWEHALADFERCIEMEAIPEAYYNIAQIYEQTGEPKKAEEMIVIAYEMRPEEEQFIEAYERITGKDSSN